MLYTVPVLPLKRTTVYVYSRKMPPQPPPKSIRRVLSAAAYALLSLTLSASIYIGPYSLYMSNKTSITREIGPSKYSKFRSFLSMSFFIYLYQFLRSSSPPPLCSVWPALSQWRRNWVDTRITSLSTSTIRPIGIPTLWIRSCTPAIQC